MTALRELIMWMYWIDMRDEDFSFGMFADWLEDHGETKLARGFRLVNGGNRSSDGKSVIGYEPNDMAAVECLWDVSHVPNEDRAHSYDWEGPQSSVGVGKKLTKEVYDRLRGGQRSSGNTYHEFPSRSAAFFALAEALAELDEEN